MRKNKLTQAVFLGSVGILVLGMMRSETSQAQSNWQRQQQQQQQQQQRQYEMQRQQQQAQQRQQMQDQQRQQMQAQQRQQMQQQQRQQMQQQQQAQQRQMMQQQATEQQRRQMQQRGVGQPTAPVGSNGLSRVERPLTSQEIYRGFTGKQTADGRALIKYKDRILAVPASRVSSLLPQTASNASPQRTAPPMLGQGGQRDRRIEGIVQANSSPPRASASGVSDIRANHQAAGIQARISEARAARIRKAD
jgi:flagellar biosynthesis GTPase FlhF